MLEGWLRFHRATLRWKCEGLEPAQLRERSVPPSTMSLHGLVRHMAEVERSWFQRALAERDAPYLYCTEESPDADFDDLDGADFDTDLATWQEQIDEADRIASEHELDDAGSGRGNPVSLRWIYAHMIEEYARHNGHADLLRERIDGATGD